MNGTTATPLAPTAATNAIALTCNLPGRTFVTTTTAPGNISPNQKPTNATRTAQLTKLGISYKRNSKTVARSRYQAKATFSLMRPVTKPRRAKVL
jgi:hypothetical protein